ncbi:MAG: cell wall hydrolase [Sphingomonadales bacterium]|nr:cell wall hydrolase [Sphingomonadales bacterium]MBU3992431.1 cell wall hydrolase [Alphaproteobacteria bacterium]
MSRKLDIASALSIALTVGLTLVTAGGSGAAAESRNPQARIPQLQAEIPAGAEAPDSLTPEISAAPAATITPTERADALAAAVSEPAETAITPATLRELVAAQDTSGELSRNLECLAGAIYFESKSEPLDGQLAVGRVIVNRARSGRFPDSYCGVVFQRAQFSFVRGSAMPVIKRTSRAWKTAVAVARIANEGSWTSKAEGALFFHATRVSPKWRLTRIARIDNHVFYR